MQGAVRTQVMPTTAELLPDRPLPAATLRHPKISEMSNVGEMYPLSIDIFTDSSLTYVF